MKNYITTLSVFAAGACSGWIADSTISSSPKVTDNQEASSQLHKAQPTRKAARRQSASNSREARLSIGKKQLVKFRAAGLDGINNVETLGLNYRAILEQLMEESGVGGLDRYDQGRANASMIAWHNEDPEAATKFLMELKNPKDRKNFAYYILTSKMGSSKNTPYLELLALAQEFEPLLKNRNGSVDLPRGLFLAAAQQSEDELYKLCIMSKSTPYKRGFSYNMTDMMNMKVLKYPENFNFKSILERLSQHSDSLPKGHYIHELPNNLLSTWASRDPHAAYEWLNSKENHRLPENNTMEEFFSGYKKTATPEDLGKFLADTVLHTESDRGTPNYSELIEAIRFDSTDKITNVLEAFCQNFPNQEDANWHLTRFLEEVTFLRPHAAHAILNAMPRKNHLDLIRNMESIVFEDKVIETYKKHGHTQEEIQKAIDSNPNSRSALRKKVQQLMDAARNTPSNGNHITPEALKEMHERIDRAWNEGSKKYKK